MNTDAECAGERVVAIRGTGLLEVIYGVAARGVCVCADVGVRAAGDLARYIAFIACRCYIGNGRACRADNLDNRAVSCLSVFLVSI